jgi:DNA-binding NarL/FixJ family response regulator
MPTVVTGKFEDLVSAGLEALIGEEPSLELVARDVPMPEVEAAVAKHSPSSKDTEARDIINAIHLASRGMHVLPRSAAEGGGLDRLGDRGADLTRREAEVLELLQDGWTNAQISDKLSIGIETVRTHARSIYRKLGIASRRELARQARQEPVVVDEERRPVPVPG